MGNIRRHKGGGRGGRKEVKAEPQQRTPRSWKEKKNQWLIRIVLKLPDILCWGFSFTITLPPPPRADTNKPCWSAHAHNQGIAREDYYLEIWKEILRSYLREQEMRAGARGLLFGNKPCTCLHMHNTDSKEYLKSLCKLLFLTVPSVTWYSP